MLVVISPAKSLDMSPVSVDVTTRFKAFAAAPAAEQTKAAAFMFDGDTYQGFEAKTLDADALSWAQEHLRILSGLYGLLRPLDAIQPYRLEMGSRLKTRRGKSLYDYWGDALAKGLNVEAGCHHPAIPRGKGWSGADGQLFRETCPRCDGALCGRECTDKSRRYQKLQRGRLCL